MEKRELLFEEPRGHYLLKKIGFMLASFVVLIAISFLYLYENISSDIVDYESYKKFLVAFIILPLITVSMFLMTLRISRIKLYDCGIEGELKPWSHVFKNNLFIPYSDVRYMKKEGYKGNLIRIQTAKDRTIRILAKNLSGESFNRIYEILCSVGIENDTDK